VRRLLLFSGHMPFPLLTECGATYCAVSKPVATDAIYRVSVGGVGDPRLDLRQIRHASIELLSLQSMPPAMRGNENAAASGVAVSH
jgi:hypothetical protein